MSTHRTSGEISHPIHAFPAACGSNSSFYHHSSLTHTLRIFMQDPTNASDTTPAIIGCCKHFVAYSVEETQDGIDRHHFNAVVNGHDLLETYFPGEEGRR